MNAREKVRELLKDADSAHRIDHIDRVTDLSLRFADAMSISDIRVIRLTALLHDVDDYKLFGQESAESLTNACNILDELDIQDSIKNKVLAAIREIGFNRRLQEIRPTTIEAMIVSDADMCDAMGIGGILRAIQYGESIGRPFFEQNTFPRRNVTYDQYVNYPPDTTMCVIFEKLLRLRTMMMTAQGYEEALKRNQAMIQFLRSYFTENGLNEWHNFLSDYLVHFDR